MIPETSPVSRALLATPKTIENERRLLKRKSPTLVRTAIDSIDAVGELSVYSPTKTQCESMLNALKAAVSNVEKQFSEIRPRQVTFELE
jgi:ABC-type transporter Mla subunit MlaD